MNINEVLNGSEINLSIDEQKTVLEQMKEKKFFDLQTNEKKSLIDFLCEKSDSELSIDYLFHVLDTEISYPIDDDKVKDLFSDNRMKKIKDLMMDKLQDSDDIDDSSDSSEPE